MSRHWISWTGARAAGLLVCGAVLLLLPACDGGLIAKSPREQLEKELAPAFGDELAERIAAAWEPMLSAQDRIAEAELGEDFVAYHAASMEMGEACRSAVDETIRLLGEDGEWRRKVFAEVVIAGVASDGDAGSSGETGATAGGEIGGLFPTVAEPDQEWLAKGALQQPRLAGELVRVLLEIQGDLVRLAMYFAGAMGEEAMKAASEAMEGFKNPR